MFSRLRDRLLFWVLTKIEIEKEFFLLSDTPCLIRNGWSLVVVFGFRLYCARSGECGVSLNLKFICVILLEIFGETS